nr:class B sortase [Colidextribacter sp. OB.20]
MTSPVRPAVPKDQECEPILPIPHELSLRLSHFVDEYSDAAIWLQIPDTPLDYPVMLGTDNQFYLNHLPNGNKNALGSLFLDYRTNEDSVHLIVYGHNGSGGKMFGLLKQYESQDYFLGHKTLTVATSDAVYVCPIFSVRRVEAGGNAYRLEFEDNNSLTDYINQAVAESLYPIDVELENAARVLTLSTCTGWRNQRFIVQAIMR